jgi:hypothetical protein
VRTSSCRARLPGGTELQRRAGSATIYGNRAAQGSRIGFGIQGCSKRQTAVAAITGGWTISTRKLCLENFSLEPARSRLPAIDANYEHLAGLRDRNWSAHKGREEFVAGRGRSRAGAGFNFPRAVYGERRGESATASQNAGETKQRKPYQKNVRDYEIAVRVRHRSFLSGDGLSEKWLPRYFTVEASNPRPCLELRPESV